MKLTMPSIAAAKPAAHGKRRMLADDDVRGLVVRITETGAKSWWFRYWHRGERKAIRVGSFPTTTLVDARKLARQHRVAVDDGLDPAGERREARGAATMADLWTRYWEQHAEPHKRSADKDRERWELHVEPAWGKRPVDEITYAEVGKLKAAMSRVRVVERKGRSRKVGGPGVANRVLALLSKMFGEAEKWGMRTPGSNPVRGVGKFAERRIERYLSDAEYAELFRVLGEADDVAAVVRDALALLVYTGLRAGEVVGARREHVDTQRGQLILPATKTTPRRLPLAPEALAIVTPRATGRGAIGPWLFPRPGDPAEPLGYDQLDRSWRRIRERAGLDDVRLHDLRHGFASVAAAAGMSLPEIGQLLGHRSPLTTHRYVHLVDDHARTNATAVGARIHAAAQGQGKVVPLRRK